MPVNLGSDREQRSSMYWQRLIFLFAGFFVLLCAGHSVFAQQADVHAQLSANSITRDESVSLTITARGIDAALDASALNKDFDVVGRSSSRQVKTLINGNGQRVNTSEVVWVLELVPRGVGVFTVPAVKVGDLETQLQTLTVNEIPQGAQRDVFVEAVVDTTEPWVQSQVVLTLSVFQAIELVNGGMDMPYGNDLVVERIGEDVQRNESRDGRQYLVTDRRFALFPQKSGALTIEPIALNVTVLADPNRARGFFSPTRKLTRRTDPIELNVRPRPVSTTGNAGSWWLPARSLELFSQWQGDPRSAAIDTPLTRTIVMRAQGVLDSQLPEIEIPAVEGLSVYAETPQLIKQSDGSGLVAEQRISWALIPQRAGVVTLPEITVEWFDTQTGQTQTAVLSEETIEVADASVATNAIPPTSSSVGSGNGTGINSSDNLRNNAATGLSAGNDPLALSSGALDSASAGSSGADVSQLRQNLQHVEESLANWRLLALALLALWLVSMSVWMWHRYRRSNITQYGQRSISAVRNISSNVQERIVPMAALNEACNEGDLLNVRLELLAWAAKQWPENAPQTLSSLSSLLPESRARDCIRTLDKCLYSKSGYEEQKSTLSEELAKLPGWLKEVSLGVPGTGRHDSSVKHSEASDDLPAL